VAFCTVHTDWIYCGLWQCPGDFALNESVHFISSLGLFSSLPLTLFISCLCSVPSFLAERTTGCMAHGCSVGPGCRFVGWLRVVLGVWWGMISPPSLRQFLLSLGFFALGSSVRFFFFIFSPLLTRFIFFLVWVFSNWLYFWFLWSGYSAIDWVFWIAHCLCVRFSWVRARDACVWSFVCVGGWVIGSIRFGLGWSMVWRWFNSRVNIVLGWFDSDALGLVWLAVICVDLGSLLSV